jgi:L-alanine-DL-glutamate epimerase-like enolase superfamily enzyme
MIIRDVVAVNLTIPYGVPYRPAWQPGLVRDNRAFTIVKIVTDDGIVGYGGSDGHQAGIIESSVKPYMVGKPAWATELHARTFRNAGGTWFVDLALWDIIGKTANLPLCRIWGTCREKIRAYASTAELGTPKDRADLARRYQAEGFRALKLRFHNETMDDDLALLDAAMSAAPGMTVMVDANQATFLPSARPSPRWDYRRALATARELETRNVEWLEEPLAKFDYEGLARLCAETDLYIAGGESNRELHEFQLLIERGCYDIIQPDCCLSEGISQLRKIAALCEARHRHFIPHHGLSGFGLAATLHLACSTPELGSGWMEMMYEPPTRTIETYQRLGGIIESTIWIDGEGFVRPPEGPGLGLRVNEDLFANYAA